MNKFLNNLERKIGKYAISNLSLYIILCYVIGYMLMISGSLSFLTLNPHLIFHGEIWRVVTWVIVPPSSFGIFTIIMLLFYYSLGTNLERTWGTFRYNVYMFSGMFFTVIGTFLLYFGFMAVGIPGELSSQYIQAFTNTYYINMSIFLAFAACYPDMRVYLYFFIPIKIKWMAIVYAVVLVFEVFSAPNRFCMIVKGVILFMSLLNFIVFFFTSTDFRRISPKEMKRRADFKRSVNEAMRNRNKNMGSYYTSTKGTVITKHKCAVCGQTEASGNNLEFRFCSKCNGNYEYCQNHLFTHKHVE